MDQLIVGDALSADVGNINMKMNASINKFLVLQLVAGLLNMSMPFLVECSLNDYLFCEPTALPGSGRGRVAAVKAIMRTQKTPIRNSLE